VALKKKVEMVRSEDIISDKEEEEEEEDEEKETGYDTGNETQDEPVDEEEEEKEKEPTKKRKRGKPSSKKSKSSSKKGYVLLKPEVRIKRLVVNNEIVGDIDYNTFIPTAFGIEINKALNRVKITVDHETQGTRIVYHPTFVKILEVMANEMYPSTTTPEKEINWIDSIIELIKTSESEEIDRNIINSACDIFKILSTATLEVFENKSSKKTIQKKKKKVVNTESGKTIKPKNKKKKSEPIDEEAEEEEEEVDERLTFTTKKTVKENMMKKIDIAFRITLGEVRKLHSGATIDEIRRLCKDLLLDLL